jgi:hypothetical protein
MTSRIAQWTIDAVNVEDAARFWAAALDLEMDLGPDGSARLYPRNGGGNLAQTVWVQHVETPKFGKNRAHPDLVTDHGSAELEVDRLIALGARLADVGQTGEEAFVVLTDPAGNEFCVLDGPPPGAPHVEESDSGTALAQDHLDSAIGSKVGS